MVGNHKERFLTQAQAFGFHSSGHHLKSDADGGGCLELHSDVILIIFLQKGTVNDIEEVLLMLRPVFLSQFSGYLSELSGKVIT